MLLKLSRNLYIFDNYFDHSYTNMMNSKTISPEIISFSWGEIITPNHTYKDAKLFPGGSRKWDWTETDTHHKPGIQPADVQELLDHHADFIILSKGINQRLQTASETKSLLKKCDCEYFILQSEEAVKKYNTLRKTKDVAMLLHSTC